jgi:triosephosphate isomerase
LLAANWKMNPSSLEEAVDLARAWRDAASGPAGEIDVVLFVPFLWMLPIAAELKGSGAALGAQDCYWEPDGAFTGEVSAAMLSGHCQWVLTGHSERRRLFGETDQDVARKARASLSTGLKVVICVGEREDEHLEDRTAEVVRNQVFQCLRPLADCDLRQVAIAYEPVWAIGTGRNADPAYAADVLGMIRSLVGAVAGEDVSRSMRLLYGGSVKAANIASYVDLADCDGALPGGASLQKDQALRMVDLVAGARAT